MIKSIQRRSLPWVLPSSNPFAGGVTGGLLVFCLWLMPAVLPANAASGGTVVAWGQNYNGQTNVPAGLSGVTAIAAGAYHTVTLVAPQPPQGLLCNPPRTLFHRWSGAPFLRGQSSSVGRTWLSILPPAHTEIFPVKPVIKRINP